MKQWVLFTNSPILPPPPPSLSLPPSFSVLFPEWKQWQETGTLKRNNTASESIDEDRSIPLQPFGNEVRPLGNGAPRKTPRKPPREITTIPEEEEPPAAPPPSTAGKKK